MRHFSLTTNKTVTPEYDGCLLSVVIPLLNEQENVGRLIVAVRTALAGLDYEIIAVDDGSTDDTVARLRESAGERLKVIVMSRNFGQTSAMSAGIAWSCGAYIATLDGDLQNDPDDIPHMLSMAQEGGWDIVAGYRANRLDGFLLRKLPSRIANTVIRRLTRVDMRDYGCTLKVFRKEVATQLGLYGELHRFIPVLGNLIGARMTEVPVKHHKRVFGQSKYGLGRTSRVISDLLLMVYLQRWGKKPMHLFGSIGGILLGTGALLLLFQAFLMFANTAATLGGLMMALSGVGILLTGLMAEVQMRIYYESSGKTPYVIREIFQDLRQSSIVSPADSLTDKAVRF